jgi:hypothetical protein
VEIVWAIIGIAVPALIGIGLALIAMPNATPTEFLVARICFCLSAFILLVSTLLWELRTQYPLYSRVIVGSLIGVLFFVVFPLSIQWLHTRQNQPKESAVLPQAAPNSAIAKPPPDASAEAPVFEVGPTTDYLVELGSNMIAGDIRDGVQAITRTEFFVFGDEFTADSKIENDRLYIDAKIYGGLSRAAIQLVHNKVVGLPRNWDANFDNEAIEIVDEKKQPVFQLEYKDKMYISIRGFLWTIKGNVVAIDDKRIKWHQGNSPPGDISLNRLFRYPAANHKHEREAAKTTPPL